MKYMPRKFPGSPNPARRKSIITHSAKKKVQLAEATLYAYLALEKDGPQYAQLLNTAREDLAELYASAGVGKGERSATALAEKFERDTRAAIAEQKGIIELS
ncbi:MAG: hypothetical protein WDN72_08970 [Alphaproteobacteria bacterium]